MATELDPLSKSCLVVAHPDDELMWFSSVLADIDQIVFCFADAPGFPGLSRGRATLVDSYPSGNLRTCDLTEAGVFDSAFWPEPETSDFGLRLKQGHSASARRYVANFALLQERLASLLLGYENVYTHNPWGEYGHEEHVQVFRAVDGIRRTEGFNMWCPSYVSTRSHALMVREVRRLSEIHHHRPTDNDSQCRLYELYRRHGAWTWPGDMVGWFPSESMFLISNSPPETGEPRYLPMNFIDMVPPAQNWLDKPLRQLGRSIIRRIISRPNTPQS